MWKTASSNSSTALCRRFLSDFLLEPQLHHPFALFGVCLFVCLSVCLLVCLSVCPFVIKDNHSCHHWISRHYTLKHSQGSQPSSLWDLFWMQTQLFSIYVHWTMDTWAGWNLVLWCLKLTCAVKKSMCFYLSTHFCLLCCFIPYLDLKVLLQMLHGKEIPSKCFASMWPFMFFL